MPPFQLDMAVVYNILAHFLVSLRFLALLLTASVFMLPVAPNTLRFYVSMIMTAVALPMTGAAVPVALLNNWTGVLLIGAREFIIGGAIGFVSGLPLYAMQLSGFFDSTIIGFNMMNMVDPTSSAQVSVLSQLKYMLAIWFYFHWNGHLLLIQALSESIRLVPPGMGSLVSGVGAATIPWMEWLQRVFILGARLSLPVIGACLLAEVGLGFVARTVPQMNVFMLGVPLKIVIGGLVLFIVLPSTVDIIHGEIENAVTWALEGIHIWK